jgi:hypothetical protein
MALSERNLRRVYQAYSRLLDAAEAVLKVENETGIPARRILFHGYRAGLRRGLDTLIMATDEVGEVSNSSGRRGQS